MRRHTLITTLCAAAIWAIGTLGAETAQAAFGIAGFGLQPVNASGEPYTQAGGHPYELKTTITFNSETVGRAVMPVLDPKDVSVELPPGMIGDPQATPRCPLALFDLSQSHCPASSQVGSAETILGGNVHVDGVFNIEAGSDRPALLGLTTVFGVHFLLNVGVRPSQEYRVDTGDEGVPMVSVSKVKLTLWGVPADPSHDAMRGLDCWVITPGEPINPSENLCAGDGGEVSNDPQVPFLTMPTRCTDSELAAAASANSWEEPGSFVSAEALLPSLSGCDVLAFHPAIDLRP